MRSGGRTDSVHDRLRRGIHEHLEQLFTRLRVIDEGAVGKPETRRVLEIADDIHHTSAVQRPEAEMADDDGDNRSGFRYRRCGNGLKPADVEVLPCRQSRFGAIEISWAAAD